MYIGNELSKEYLYLISICVKIFSKKKIDTKSVSKKIASKKSDTKNSLINYFKFERKRVIVIEFQKLLKSRSMKKVKTGILGDATEQ